MMNQESSSESTITQISDQLFMNLKLNDEEKADQVHEFEEAQQFDEEHDYDQEHEDEDEDEEDDDDFSFSMAFDGVIDQTQITAEDAFSNGLIKPVFPFFNQDLLLQEGLNMEELIANNGQLANVKKVFVPATASTSGYGNISGPYCDWDKKSVETCKKSNSTGFSKIWRFKDFMHRSSSDGKDAFVFLNDTSSPSSAAAAVSRKREEKKKVVPESKVKVVAGESTTKMKGKKIVKSKKAAPSPHEVYLKSKAREEQRRRSYHSYRPEVVGLFTNITGGGLTRNVHPF